MWKTLFAQPKRFVSIMRFATRVALCCFQLIKFTSDMRTRELSSTIKIPYITLTSIPDMGLR